MDIRYRKTFLKDLEKLKGLPVYEQVYELVFITLPAINYLKDVSSVKSMKGYPSRYRIRIGNYRIGIEYDGHCIELMRILHRREFYRFFP